MYNNYKIERMSKYIYIRNEELLYFLVFIDYAIFRLDV